VLIFVRLTVQTKLFPSRFFVLKPVIWEVDTNLFAIEIFVVPLYSAQVEKPFQEDVRAMRQKFVNQYFAR